jgi:MFS family permease
MGAPYGLHLSPGSLLCLFTLANTLIYMDRGVIGVISTQATLETLASKDQMDLSGTSAGALGSIFILGFMLSSPIFAYSSQTIGIPTLIGSGLLIWSLSTLMAGLATDYWMLLLARAATGIGEAAIVSLVPPLVLDTAPSDKKTVSLYAAVGVRLLLRYDHRLRTGLYIWTRDYAAAGHLESPVSHRIRYYGSLHSAHLLPGYHVEIEWFW